MRFHATDLSIFVDCLHRPTSSSMSNRPAGARPRSQTGGGGAILAGAKKEKFSARELESLGDAATWSKLDVIG